MNSLRTKLSFMMFLEFFIWGAWLPLTFTYLPYLKFSPLEQSLILNAFAFGSLVGMFFSNQFVDRNFAAEKFLAVSHLIGGLAIMGLAYVTNFWAFFFLMLIHSLFYVPTISITNAIAFANLKDPQNEFAPVRRMGTIGWIAASIPMIFLLADWTKIPALSEVGVGSWISSVLNTSLTGDAGNRKTAACYVVAGIASLALAVFSLILPHTPPKKQEEGAPWALGESLALLKSPFIMILFLVTFIDATVHQCYFVYTGGFLKTIGIQDNWVASVMSVGQVAEIITMTILGMVLAKFGWRTTMILGVLGHVIRFGVFALAPTPSVVVTVILLHGVCYAFFFATLYIFIDEYFPKDARTSSQGLFNLLIIGLGPAVGNIGGVYFLKFVTTVSEKMVDGKTVSVETVDYRTIFLTLSGIAMVAATLLAVFFHPPKIKVPEGAGH